jgi:copper(I)-binding protein
MRERHSTPRRTVTGVLAASAMVLALAACGDDEGAAPATDGPAAETASAEASVSAEAGGGIAVTEAWSRQPAEGQAVTAVYGIVTNDSDADVTIVAATSSVTDEVELHETLTGDDGTMKMQEKEGGFVVPAGGAFVFESGGPHIMLFGIDPASYPDSVDVTLELDTGEAVAFTAEVRAIDSTEMSGMETSGDDMHG